MAALAVAVGLSACSSPVEAGAAAIVGSERISASELTKNVDEFEAALEKAKIPANQLPMPPVQYVLFQMVNISQFSQIADKAGTKVTEGEIDQIINAQGGAATVEPKMLQQGVPPAFVRDWLRTSIAVTKLMQQFGGGTDQAAQQAGQQKLFDEAATVKVTYNPRYGTFDANQGTFVANNRFGKAPALPAAPQQ